MRCKMRRKVTCWGGFFDSAIVGPNVSLASAAATTTLRRSKVAAATGCEQKVTTTAKTLTLGTELIFVGKYLLQALTALQ